MRGTEFIAFKRKRSRKKKRQLWKRRRDQLRGEVRSAKRQKVLLEGGNAHVETEKLTRSMQAEAFWKNYTAAQEWQNRHSVTWWRSRCLALEYENQVLREKIRSLVHQNGQQNSSRTRNEYQEPPRDNGEDSESQSDNENLEFQVNEDMMSFLEQSIRHKIELKQKRDLAAAEEETSAEQPSLEGGAAWVRTRNENAKLLYGEDSSRILAMETALQATVDRHKDRAKPQYWPNIPLKP